jgi:hypothetical protein
VTDGPKPGAHTHSARTDANRAGFRDIKLRILPLSAERTTGFNPNSIQLSGCATRLTV